MQRKILSGLLLIAAALAALPACTQQALVPANAITVQSSSPDSNGTVLYRVSDPGQLYVLNRNTNELLYSGFVHKDDPVVIDTMAGRILVNNAVVTQRPLGRGDSYDFKLDRDVAARTTVIERRTIIREGNARD
jgi:hypothetical protein